MSAERTCDNCKARDGLEGKLLFPPGWIDVRYRPARSRGTDFPIRALDFCSVLCLAEWSIDRIEPEGPSEAEETREERVRRLNRERQKRHRAKVASGGNRVGTTNKSPGRPPHLMTTDQVAGRLGVSRTTVAKMCVRGDLSAVKVGSLWRIRRESVDDLYAGNGTGHRP